MRVPSISANLNLSPQSGVTLLSRSSRILVKPLDISAVFPDADFASAVHFNEGTAPVLLSIVPLAVVDAAVLPLKDTFTLPLVVHEVALVLLPVGPLQQAAPVHFVLLPLATVGLSIGPHVLASA